VDPSIYVGGDAAATAGNVLANPELVRIGVFAHLVDATFFVLMALTLYQLLKHVNKSVARAMLVFVALAVGAYTISDNDLPAEFHHLLHVLRVNPERKFFADLAVQIGRLTEANVLWAAAGTLVYSLFSLVEGIGLLFRVPWACWMTIGESAFFVPIEVYELVHRASRERFPWVVFGILVINVVIVWYLLQNRHRLFRHHHHHDEVP
jgi:uncharacterized membrane protein (DUF2068 family)